MTLAQHFAAYSEWRSRISGVLDAFAAWLVEHELTDAQTDRRIAHLLEKLREDRLHVAFVAEFSRGKSELINAIFFAGYGNRILPSTAGRTTMCPTELMYDRSKPPSIELLPIETRESNSSIGEYKRFPDEWEFIPIDPGSADGMQNALRHVSDVVRVDAARAERLGFALTDGDSTIFRVDEQGTVEIPRWRHAVINFPHPLLAQGLVILDTPGLNAIGTEPELTLSLLPNAHAVLFILAADTVVALGRRILPKAADDDQVRECLEMLSGRRHQVITAVAWAVGLIVAVSAFVTRVIAIPKVNAWLTKLGVGATPAPDAPKPAKVSADGETPAPRRAIEG